MGDRSIDKMQMMRARLEELENENDYLNGDIEFLSDQLEKNLDEVDQILEELTVIAKQELSNSLADLKTGNEVHFEPDFDLEPEDK